MRSVFMPTSCPPARNVAGPPGKPMTNVLTPGVLSVSWLMLAVVLKEPVRVPDMSLSSESRSTPVLSTPRTSCVPPGVCGGVVGTSLLMLLPPTVTDVVIPETFAMSAVPFCPFQETRRPAGYEDREGEGLADRDGRVVRRTRPGGMAPLGAAVAAPERRGAGGGAE